MGFMTALEVSLPLLVGQILQEIKIASLISMGKAVEWGKKASRFALFMRNSFLYVRERERKRQH